MSLTRDGVLQVSCKAASLALSHATHYNAEGQQNPDQKN